MQSDPISLGTVSTGLLVARIVVGVVMAAHGTQKLLGWFGGYGLQKTGELFAQLGFKPGTLFAAAASLTEILGGLLLALGFLGPVGPALIISVMIVAMITVHWSHGLFAASNGIEVPLLYLAAAVSLGFSGYGQYSVDAWLGIADRWTPATTWIIIATGVLGGFANVALRRGPAPARAERA